jgi:hypothetical protein
MKPKEIQRPSSAFKDIKEKRFENLSKTFKETNDEFKDNWVQNNGQKPRKPSTIHQVAPVMTGFKKLTSLTGSSTLPDGTTLEETESIDLIDP